MMYSIYRVEFVKKIEVNIILSIKIHPLTSWITGLIINYDNNVESWWILSRVLKVLKSVAIAGEFERVLGVILHNI